MHAVSGTLGYRRPKVVTLLAHACCLLNLISHARAQDAEGPPDSAVLVRSKLMGPNPGHQVPNFLQFSVTLPSTVSDSGLLGGRLPLTTSPASLHAILLWVS